MAQPTEETEESIKLPKGKILPKEFNPKLNLKNNVKQKRLGGQLTEEMKAHIIACILSDQFDTDADIAREVKVSKMTVSRIRHAIPPDMLQTVTQRHQDKIGMLFMEVLKSGLASLKRISDITLNEGWLIAQSAEKLASLYQVKADKIIQILEALERAQSQGTESEGNISATET